MLCTAPRDLISRVGYTAKALIIRTEETTAAIQHISHPLNHASRTIPSAFRLGQRSRPDFRPTVLCTLLLFHLPHHWMLIFIHLDRLIPRPILLEASGRIHTRMGSFSKRTQKSERRSTLMALGARNRISLRLISRKVSDVIPMVERPLRPSLSPPGPPPPSRANTRIVVFWERSKIKLLEPKRSARLKR